MFNQRIEKLRNKFAEKNLDAFLVSNFYNILYLTGFKTLTTDEREAFVLVTKNDIYLFTDERYIDKNSKVLKSYNPKVFLKLIEPGKGLLSHLGEIVTEEKIQNLGFETEDLRHFEYENIRLMFQTIQLHPTARFIMALREVKDADEIEKAKRAGKKADECFTNLVKVIQAGMTEKEIAFKLEVLIRNAGSELAFDPIVAIDQNAAVPHYNTKTGNGIVKNTSVILVDFGVKYEDYLSDVTRMIFYGKPSDEVMKTYAILQKAQEQTVEYISQCRILNEPDTFCRKLLTDNLFPSYPHSTGHGVGLEIHEYPKVSFNSRDLKKDGQIFTVEPGVYFAGKWGMRVEDTVVIKNGKAEALTKYSKGPVILNF